MIPVAITILLMAPGFQPSPTVRARLAVYERRISETGRHDPAELAAMARTVIDGNRRSQKFAVWSEACASTTVEDTSGCTNRLWAVFNGPDQPLVKKAEAGAALIARGDAKAADAMFTLFSRLDPPKLVPLVPIVAQLPATRAVPLLIRLTEVPHDSAQASACRALGAFDTPESRAALGRMAGAHPPGTRTWLLCMVARGRLREPDAQPALSGYGHTLGGDDLVDAAAAMAETGQDATQLLTDLTRRGSARGRIAAATALVERNPEAAIRVADESLGSPDPSIRAASLELERKLKREPSRRVRERLVDPAEGVQIAAAEVALDWAKRQQTR